MKNLSIYRNRILPLPFKLNLTEMIWVLFEQFFFTWLYRKLSFCYRMINNFIICRRKIICEENLQDDDWNKRRSISLIVAWLFWIRNPINYSNKEPAFDHNYASCIMWYYYLLCNYEWRSEAVSRSEWVRFVCCARKDFTAKNENEKYLLHDKDRVQGTLHMRY